MLPRHQRVEQRTPGLVVLLQLLAGQQLLERLDVVAFARTGQDALPFQAEAQRLGLAMAVLGAFLLPIRVAARQECLLLLRLSLHRLIARLAGGDLRGVGGVPGGFRLLIGALSRKFCPLPEVEHAKTAQQQCEHQADQQVARQAGRTGAFADVLEVCQAGLFFMLCRLLLAREPRLFRVAHDADQPVVDQLDARHVALRIDAQQPALGQAVEFGWGQCAAGQRFLAWKAAAVAAALDQVVLDEGRDPRVGAFQGFAVEIEQDVLADALQQGLIDLRGRLASVVELVAAQAQQHRLDFGGAAGAAALVAVEHEIDDLWRHARRQHVGTGLGHRIDGGLAGHRLEVQRLLLGQAGLAVPALHLGQKVGAERQHHPVLLRLQVQAFRRLGVAHQFAGQPVTDQVGQRVEHLLDMGRRAAA